jgi:SagB-type dehydrogenase family enzyme
MAPGPDEPTDEYLVNPGFELSLTADETDSATIRGSVAGGATLHKIGPLILSTVMAATEPSSTHALIRRVASRGNWSASTVAQTVERLKRESVLIARDTDAFDHSYRWVAEGWIESLHYHLAAPGSVVKPPRPDDQFGGEETVTPEVSLDTYELPDPVTLPDRPLSTTLRERETCREFSGNQLDSTAIATVLGHAQVTLDNGGAVHAASSSPGGCYSTYVVVVRSRDVSRGVYEYRPGKHRLTPVQQLSAAPTEIDDRVQRALISQAYARGCSFLLVVTVDYDHLRERFTSSQHLRSGFVGLSMYAHRYLLTATACDLATFQTGAYHDARLADLLGLEGFDEQPGFVLAFGREQ